MCRQFDLVNIIFLFFLSYNTEMREKGKHKTSDTKMSLVYNKSICTKSNLN